MSKSVKEIESLIQRLPMTERNMPYYEALLRLPYEQYKPLLEMIVDEKITIEDLMPSRYNVDVANALGSVSSMLNTEVTEPSPLVDNIQSKLNGEGASDVVLTNRLEQEGLKHAIFEKVNGRPATSEDNLDGIYVENTQSVITTDFNKIRVSASDLEGTTDTPDEIRKRKQLENISKLSRGTGNG